MNDQGLIPVPDDLNLGDTIRGFRPGQRLFDRYLLQKVLGRGGMGVVWLAQDEKLEQPVALKFLPETLRLDNSALDDLKRETRRGLTLAHAHIVRIYDFVDDATAAAISMEYVDGSTLSNLRVEQPLRVFEAAQLQEWATQLIEALDYAHRRVKIVHRDLKPANLMTTSTGEMKVADFGIARSISDSASRVSVRGASSGTLVYMSPQQAQGLPPKASDDIYALGATLYELLTSKPPFFSGNIQHQLDSVNPPMMAERRAELEIAGEAVPIEWERTVAACLAKDPADRPQSIAEVGERLGLRAATLPPTVAVPTPAPGKTTAPTSAGASTVPVPTLAGKQWLPVGIAGAAVLLVLGGLGYYYYGVALPAQREKEAQIAEQLAEAKAVAAALEQEKAQEAALAAQKAQEDADKAAEEEKAQLEATAQDAANKAARAAAAAQKAQDEAAAQEAAARTTAAGAPTPPPIPVTPEQLAHEKDVCTQVQALIDAKKLGAASYHLQLLTSSMPSDRAITIGTPFQAALVPYEQQRDAVLAASVNGDPAEALAQLKGFAQLNPDDPKIQMAIATVATRMPPNHDNLKDQLQQFKALATDDATVASDPTFLTLQSKFTNELRQLDSLSNRLDELKSAPKSRPSVARLVAERTDAESKLASYKMVAVPGSILYMTVASSIADKEREIASLTEKINDLQNEPIVSQSAIDEAQQKYDDFVAAVPW